MTGEKREKDAQGVMGRKGALAQLTDHVIIGVDVTTEPPNRRGRAKAFYDKRVSDLNGA